MRKLLVLVGAVLLAFMVGTASAKTLPWHGTLDMDLGALPTLRLQGSGVSTVNATTGQNHLNTLRIAGGITGSGTILVTDPETTGTIPSIRIEMTLGTGTLSGISGGPPLANGVLPLRGFTHVCLVVGCAGNLPLVHTTNGTNGLGIGGLLTIGGFGMIRISVVDQPWTLATVSGVNQTGSGGFKTVSRGGFVHGPASANSTTATESGLVQLILPQQVTVTGVAGNSTQLTLFGTLTLHFIPEPGLLLLIGSGVVGLGLLGRRRMSQ